MNDAINKPDPDVLDEAVRQLREAPVDESRLQAAMQTTRGTLARMTREAALPAGQTTSRNVVWRIFVNNMWTKVGVAAAVVLAVVGLGSWLGHEGGRNGMAFADVLRSIQQARTVTYKIVSEPIETPDSPQPAASRTTMNVATIEPDRVRMEVASGDNTATDRIHVWNLPERKSVTLWPKTQTASVHDMPTGGAIAVVGSPNSAYVLAKAMKGELDPWLTLRDLRDLDVRAAERLGQQVIDGRAAEGFRVRVGEGKDPIVVWADAQTRRPLRVERTNRQPAVTIKWSAGAGAAWSPDGAPAGSPAGTHPPIPVAAQPGPRQFTAARQVITDIIFDVPLDESLFSVNIPEGYRLLEPASRTSRNVMSSSEQATEQNLIDGLRDLAKAAGGSFPSDPTADFEAATSELMNQSLTNGWGTPEFSFRLRALGRVRVFLQEFNAQYVGRRVKLGDSQEPVVVWQPAGAQHHRAVFGDLTVRDLDDAEFARLNERIRARTFPIDPAAPNPAN